MKNLKVKVKLLVGFGLILVFVIALGAISITQLSTLNQTSQGFATTTVPAVDDIWTVRRNLISMERYLLQIITTNNLNEIATIEKNLTTDRDALMKSLDHLALLIPDFKVSISKIKEYIEKNISVRKEIVSLASQPDIESSVKAYDLYVKQYAPVFNQVATDVVSLYNDINNRISTRVKNANSTATGAYFTVLIVLALVIVFTIVLTTLITKSIVSPVKELELLAKRMAQGNFNVSLNYRSRDELGTLITSFGSLRDIILMLMDKINRMSHELEKGDLDAQIPENEFEGEYQNVAKAINHAIKELVSETLTIMNGYSKFGEGNFDAKIPEFPGKKKVFNQHFDELKGNLSSLSLDVNSLIAAAIEGKLDTRVNADGYKGDWNRLIQGLNNLLQAVNSPINDANTILAQLSRGDFDVSIQKQYKGSFAEMAKSLDSMIKSIGSYINEITQILGTLSKGDLRQEIKREYLGQFNQIKESINQISQTLRITMGDIRNSAENVLGGAKQISESAMNIANGASVQASSVEELNASIININEKTHKTAEDAQAADDFSQKSMLSAKAGNTEMSKMLVSMQELEEASANIYRIIKVIDDIAFQTSLLALNAAVEAARAGEQGKGFAVVAQEVRALASRSQDAAKETSAQIEDIRSKINDGTKTAHLTAQSLDQILSDINQVSGIISKISTASKEQKEGIAQITIGINQISDVVQRNASTSEESAAVAEELNSQSEVLAQMVSAFTV